MIWIILLLRQRIYICITWMCGFAGRGDNPLGMRNWLAELKIQASLLYRLSHA